MTGRRMVMGLGAAALVLGSSLGLTGCGRRGGLEPPPDPSAAAPVDTSRSDDGGLDNLRRPKREPIKPPHQSFFLDPIL